MTNEYSWPDATALTGEPDRAALGNLEYVCITCSVKCNSADTFKLHISGAKHRKKTTEAKLEEHPELQQHIEEYEGYEAPHRALSKEDKSAKWKAKLEEVKALKEAMTPEELLAMKEEKREAKRKRIEEGLQPLGKKKKAKGAALSYKCQICDLDLNGQDPFFAHMQGQKHVRKVMDYVGGCWLCAMMPPVQDSHFEGKQHRNNVAKLEAFGVDASMVCETGFAFAPPPPIQMMMMMKGKGGKGKGEFEQMAALFAGKAGKGKGKFEQMAALFAGKGKGKWKGKEKGAESKGAAEDKKDVEDDGEVEICWDFLKGMCNRGDECKWKH